MVDHFFTTTTHHWLLFFTNLGRVYRAKAYELPEAGRDAKGQHVANLLAFQPGEEIAQVLDIRDYAQPPYLVLATRRGLVKKTRLTEYDSNRAAAASSRSTCATATSWLGDELGSAESTTTTCCWSRARASRCASRATDETLRPMGRSTSGVTGMKFRDGDRPAGDGRGRAPGHRPRRLRGLRDRPGQATPVVQYRNVQGRGDLGIKVAKLSDKGGDLVGALTVDEDDEVLVDHGEGQVVRSRVDEVRLTGRNTMGVQFAKAGKNDAIVAIALNPERAVEEAVEAVEAAEGDDATEADADVTGTASGVVAGEDSVSGSGPAGSGVADEGDDAVPSVDDEDEGGRE